MKSIFLSFALVVTPLSEVQAQGATGPEALRELHAFARCVAERDPTASRRVLSTDFRTQEYSSRLDELMRSWGRCTRGRLQASSILFAGALAEEVAKRELRGRTLTAATAFDPALPGLQARNGAEFMAFCVIRSDPGLVSGLFGSEAGSVEERAAIDALAPKLPGCMLQGESGQFNAAGLRAMLATGAYRLIQHNSAPVAAARN